MHHQTRLFPRLPVHLEVKYRSGKDLASSFVESLSSGGVFIRTSRPLPIGTDLIMEIEVEGEAGAITIKGRVVWERLIGREDGMGVAFLEDPPERLKNLLTTGVA